MPTPITKAILPDIIERLRNGAPLIGESKALGYSHNGPLRTALREHLGKDGYDALMQAKRPVALTRVRDESGELAPQVDDTGVRVITGTPTAEGWRTRYAGVHDETIFIAPDGTRYEKAPGNATADLIVDLTERGLGRVRLRLCRGLFAMMKLGNIPEVKSPEPPKKKSNGKKTPPAAVQAIPEKKAHKRKAVKGRRKGGK